MLICELEQPIKIVVESFPTDDSPKIIEWIVNIATLLIALGSLFMSVYVFREQRADTKANNDSVRKLNLMKTLILDQSMPYFYDIFKRLTQSTEKLKKQSCLRDEVEREIQSLLRELNEQIISLFLAVDSYLYRDLLDLSDDCRDNLVIGIGDLSLDFQIEELYRRHILNHIESTKREILRLIYNYEIS